MNNDCSYHDNGSATATSDVKESMEKHGREKKSGHDSVKGVDTGWTEMVMTPHF